MSKCRHLSAEFKARVVKEALKGEKTIAEIATDNEISPSQVNTWKKVRSAGERSERKAMIDKNNKAISIRRQCKLLGVNRNRLTPAKPQTSEEDHEILSIIDDLYLKHPHFGTRSESPPVKPEA